MSDWSQFLARAEVQATEQFKKSAKQSSSNKAAWAKKIAGGYKPATGPHRNRSKFYQVRSKKT